MKKNALKLNKETVRTLSELGPDQLGNVAGGEAPKKSRDYVCVASELYCSLISPWLCL